MMAREGLTDDPLHGAAQPQTEPAGSEPEGGGITLEL